ncbi:MAG: hypothetical protein Q8L68_04475, partial [Methylococcales bacterium]|nr:hypothetical protein [Methylococcales bacterium]
SLQQAKRDLDLMAAMTRLDKYQVVVIDDIGYVKKTDAETQVLFEFIVKWNRQLQDYDEIFGRERLAR